MSKLVQRTWQLPLGNYPTDFSDALKRILASRAISPTDLSKNLGDLVHVEVLNNADQAAKRLAAAILAEELILIAGDYDADGATASALMQQCLEQMGANVCYAIPNRQRHGYGFTESFFTECIKPLNAKLIVTVDNGTNSHDGIALAKSFGIDVIVTDHHLPTGGALPDADVIVNPNVEPTSSELKNLAGVGVAFYVLLALRRILIDAGVRQADQINMANMLDLVALGTLADCVSLDRNNRILVSAGLSRIRSGRISTGIDGLLKALQLSASNISAADIVYYVAPLLNSAGRLGDMRLGVECLLSGSPRMANDYALHLLELNRKRKTLENRARSQAETTIKSMMATANMQAVFCLYNQSWHEGIIGIVASRIVNLYHRPTVIFARDTNNPSKLKGSARSIDGLNILDVFKELSHSISHVILTYGGHAAAAGITIHEHKFREFKEAFEDKLSQFEFCKRIEHDGELMAEEFSIEFANTIKRIEVWGQGNPEPTFVNTFEVKSVRLVGDNHAKCILVDINSHKVLDAIAFSQFERWKKKVGTLQNIAYQVDINEWRGVRTLQLIISDAEPLSEERFAEIAFSTNRKENESLADHMANLSDITLT